MAFIYEDITNELGDSFIKATDGNRVLLIPKDEANSDYQRYLRWLENPDAEENGTIS
jgi:hypothetical protein